MVHRRNQRVVEPSVAYPFITIYDNRNEIESFYKIMKKELNGELTIDDVGFRTYKLLRNDMEVLPVL